MKKKRAVRLFLMNSCFESMMPRLFTVCQTCRQFDACFSEWLGDVSSGVPTCRLEVSPFSLNVGSRNLLHAFFIFFVASG